MKLLLIDDDAEIRSSVRMGFELQWHDVDILEAGDGATALQLIEEQRPDLVDSARLFALLNLAIYDSYLSVFENKFHFNHWRPYSAIRGAANDGNTDTEPDPDWDNTHRHTYPFPSYPSAHGCACAAAATVFASVLGDDRPIVMTTAAVDRAGPFSGKLAPDPPTRSFPSFTAAARQSTGRWMRQASSQKRSRAAA